MTGKIPSASGGRLSDEELARLLETDLDPQERALLVERLHGDPEAARTLALAASEIDLEGEGLSERTVESLLETVRASRASPDICPHCAGDIHPMGDFCPHCGARIKGNPIVCIKCRKPVREGSVYCPHCGSFFRPVGRKSMIESSWFLLVLGLVAVAAGIIFRPVLLLFLAIGCVSLGAWGAEMWTRWKRSLAVAEEIEPAEREEEAVRKKTG